MRANGANVLQYFRLPRRVQLQPGFIVLGEQVVQSVEKGFAVGGISDTEWAIDEWQVHGMTD